MQVMVSEVTPKPPGINHKHRQWVKQLDQTMTMVRDEQEKQAAAVKEKEESLRGFATKLRSAILNGEDVTFWKHSTQVKTEKQNAAATNSQPATTTAATTSPPSVPTDQDIQAFVDSVYREAVAKVSTSQPAVAAAQPAAAGGTDTITASPAAVNGEECKPKSAAARPDTPSKV